MFPPDIHDLAHRLVENLTTRKQKIAVAESCTGGLVAAALTEIAGASNVFEGGFVVYSNQAKTEQLGVTAELLERHGAVSAEAAEALAQSAREHLKTDIALSTTGIAGPGGGTAAKPVGLVYIGLARRSGAVFHYKCQFRGDRSDIRLQTVKEALVLLTSSLDE